MAFDKDTPELPLVQTHKKTTQVNIGIVIGVVIFFAIVGVVLWKVVQNPEETRSDVHQEVQKGN